MDTLIFFMLAAIILAAMFLMFAMVVTKYKAVLIESGSLKSDLLVERLVYSPYCLTYHDSQIDRTYINVVDWDKLTQERLDRCFNNNYEVEVLIKSESAGVEKMVTTSERPAGSIKKYVKSIILFKNDSFYNSQMEVRALE